MHLCGPVLTQQNEHLQTNINKWIPEKYSTESGIILALATS